VEQLEEAFAALLSAGINYIEEPSAIEEQQKMNSLLKRKKLQKKRKQGQSVFLDDLRTLIR
jgi:hypothetical protein